MLGVGPSHFAPAFAGSWEPCFLSSPTLAFPLRGSTRPSTCATPGPIMPRTLSTLERPLAAFTTKVISKRVLFVFLNGRTSKGYSPESTLVQSHQFRFKDLSPIGEGRRPRILSDRRRTAVALAQSPHHCGIGSVTSLTPEDSIQGLISRYAPRSFGVLSRLARFQASPSIPSRRGQDAPYYLRTRSTQFWVPLSEGSLIPFRESTRGTFILLPSSRFSRHTLTVHVRATRRLPAGALQLVW
jgi:hypothetical protein